MGANERKQACERSFGSLKLTHQHYKLSVTFHYV